MKFTTGFLKVKMRKMRTDLPKIDRLKLGIKKYGINSDFMRAYHAMRACIIYDKDDEFFDKWGIE